MTTTSVVALVPIERNGELHEPGTTSAIFSVPDAVAIWLIAGDYAVLDDGETTPTIPPEPQYADKLTANTFEKAQSSAINDMGEVSGSVTVNAALSNTVRMVAVGNVNITAITGLLSAQALTMHLIQDEAGGRTWTFPSNVTWQNETPPSFSTAPNKRDVAAFSHDNVGEKLVGTLGIKGAAA